MILNNLNPKYGSVKKNKRLGRGQGSGKGGTCTKGHKGAKARSGNFKKIGFEGGQMPLQRRIPKFGFKKKNKTKYFLLNLDTLQYLIKIGTITKIVNKEILLKKGILNKKKLLKILGRGKLKSKIDITANKFSKTAYDEIKKMGGKIILS
ncbi:50S ribosomal protein L15 [Candidatus Karelsulcia muelleri]|uniref:Large ribosomal subunit protein uL15 n=1 Tax=Candidatus Karelsulcia muelleri PSPU TaxID=1189303 RepID=A0AAD1AZC4_9FLAO|nr:50S ribosomal protein L15 [Candidatus Karelsulcia muelleri]NJJ98752.1 50S ribosomal protein L15 [Candidatus Karelsulcia muelleri]BAO66404.1 50S ribosomal protein L15 [Candidatus Karelsulcia muelleri PSPU]